MSLDTSCRQRGFLLCVSSSDISECLLVHPGEKWLFFCVYLLVMFQKVLSHILQAKSFSLVSFFAWHFKMFHHTSCRHRIFLLCVSSHDVSEYLVAHPTGKGLSTCVYLRMKCAVDMIDKGLLAHPTGKRLFSCVYLLRMFQNVSWNIQQAKGFSPQCIFAWHFKMSYRTSRKPRLFYCVYLLMIIPGRYRARGPGGGGCGPPLFWREVSNDDVIVCWRHRYYLLAPSIFLCLIPSWIIR